MGNVLAICEVHEAALRSSALSNINFARQAAAAHGGEVIIALLGAGAAAAAANAATFAGKVITVDDPSIAHYLAETYAPIVARLAKENNATVVCAAAGSMGKDLLPRAAALLDAGMASDISKLDSKNQFERPILAGNASSKVEVTTPIIVVTVRQSEFEAAAPLASPGTVTSAPAGAVDALGASFDRLE